MKKFLILIITALALIGCGGSGDSRPGYTSVVKYPDKGGAPVSMAATFPTQLNRGNVGDVNVSFNVDGPFKEGSMYVITTFGDGLNVVGEYFTPVDHYTLIKGVRTYHKNFKIRTDARDYKNNIEYIYFDISTNIDGESSTVVYALPVKTKDK